ncbi:MAG: hypothetical protein AABY64_04565 [Bdellovibrionota bacterium]
MKKFIMGITVGICISFALSSMFKSKTTTQTEDDSLGPNDEVIAAPIKKMNQTIKLSSSKIPDTKTPEQIQQLKPQEIPEKKILNINLSEEQVFNIEEHLQDLQKDPLTVDLISRLETVILTLQR